MENFIVWCLICTGVWNITSSFIVSTKNGLGSLYFKVIPFLTGFCCLVSGLKLLGVI